MIIIPAAVESVSSRKDKTVKIVFSTQELPPNTAGELFGLQNAIVYLAVKVEDFGREEVERLESLSVEMSGNARKSASQRLRGVLFRLWEASPEGYQDFNSFYLGKMEQVLDHFKGKLP